MHGIAPQRRRSLSELRRRLWSQLDQRVGGEKAILRVTIGALSSRLDEPPAAAPRRDTADADAYDEDVATDAR